MAITHQNHPFVIIPPRGCAKFAERRREMSRYCGFPVRHPLPQYPRMRTIRLDIVFALFLLICTPAVAQQRIVERDTYIDIWNHSGGNVLEMVQLRNKLARSGKEIRLRGYCRSACTMLITLPNACIGPRSMIGIHAPRIKGTNIIPPFVDQIMAAHYRGEILRRWNSEWRYSLEMVRIGAPEYLKLDPATKVCPMPD